jgi:hypothetical protein
MTLRGLRSFILGKAALSGYIVRFLRWTNKLRFNSSLRARRIVFETAFGACRVNGHQLERGVGGQLHGHCGIHSISSPILFCFVIFRQGSAAVGQSPEK